MSHNKLADFLVETLVRELRRNPKLQYKIMPNGALKLMRPRVQDKLKSSTHSWEGRTHCVRLPRALTR
jgi:hypothetical protein